MENAAVYGLNKLHFQWFSNKPTRDVNRTQEKPCKSQALRQISKAFTAVIQSLSTRLRKPNFCFILTPTQHHSFFRN